MIKGWSETKRFPRGGKFRLGEKNKTANGKEYPKKLDYFRFDPDNPDLIPEFEAKYGKTPRALNIMFLHDDPEEILNAKLRAYRQSGALYCSGDGVTASRMKMEGERVLTNQLGRPESAEMECGFEQCPIYQQKKCKAMVRIQFCLTDFYSSTVWQIDSTSWNTGQNLSARFEQLLRFAGRISYIPLKLVLKPHQGTVFEGGKPMKTTVFVLDLEHPFNFEDLKDGRMQIAAPAKQIAAPPLDDAMPTDLVAGTDFVDVEPEGPNELDVALGNAVKPAGTDADSRYWAAVDKIGMADEMARNLLVWSNSDPVVALEKLEATYPALKNAVDPWSEFNAEAEARGLKANQVVGLMTGAKNDPVEALRRLKAMNGAAAESRPVMTATKAPEPARRRFK